MIRMKSSSAALVISALFLLLPMIGAWTPDRVQDTGQTHKMASLSMSGPGRMKLDPPAPARMGEMRQTSRETAGMRGK